VNQLQSFSNELFIPNRGDFARGILQPYTTVEESLEELVTIYETFIKISLL
jgi:hypothetical protein